MLPLPPRFSQRPALQLTTRRKHNVKSILAPRPSSFKWFAATRQFIDVNAATAAGYEPAFGCVSGPDHGAMGVHYLNGALLGSGEVDASQPQALIYEPWQGGMRLVGVEFIRDYATWMADKNHKNSPPVLQLRKRSLLLLTAC